MQVEFQTLIRAKFSRDKRARSRVRSLGIYDSVILGLIEIAGPDAERPRTDKANTTTRSESIILERETAGTKIAQKKSDIDESRCGPPSAAVTASLF